MTFADAEEVYLALLSHPIDAWRIRNQRTLAIMRAYLASMTGRSEEETQAHYEAVIASRA